MARTKARQRKFAGLGKKTPPAAKPTICALCDLVFASLSQLKCHVRITPGHAKGQGDCECDGCDNSELWKNPRRPADARTYCYKLPAPTFRRCDACDTDILVCRTGLSRHIRGRTHIRYALKEDLYCEHSLETFLTRADREKHFVEYHVESTQYTCVECHMDVPSECALRAHIANDRIHNPQPHSHVCEPCGQSYQAAALLQHHLASKSHRPVKCIGSALCTKRFRSIVGMTCHLESGRCISGWNHDKITKGLRAYDPLKVIDRSRVPLDTPSLSSQIEDARPEIHEVDNFELPAAIEGDEDPEEEFLVVHTPTSSNCRALGEGPVLVNLQAISLLEKTPASSSGLGTGALTPASGTDYEALMSAHRICHICHKQLKTDHGLVLHLKSLVHQPRVYRCPPLESFAFPLGLGIGGQRKVKFFKTLSALLSHIESGSCTGGKESASYIMGQFEEVVNHLQQGKKRDRALPATNTH